MGDRTTTAAMTMQAVRKLSLQSPLSHRPVLSPSHPSGKLEDPMGVHVSHLLDVSWGLHH